MIPAFKDIMLPLLKYLKGSKKERPLQEIVDSLSDEFRLTKEERLKLLPSGTSLLFKNRVQWARLYLDKSGLIETPKRATYRITDRGLKFLRENQMSEINTEILMQFPEFREFINKSRKTSGTTTTRPNEASEGKETPEESIETAYQIIKEDLIQQLLNEIKKASPYFFESLVIDLLLAMGYGGSKKEAADIIGKSGDEGIDGVINEDKLGLDKIYIQAKRWNTSSVGRPEIQKFVGALKGQRAKKGIFITTSSFSKEATDYASKLEDPVILIDGNQLAELMIENNVGISIAKSFHIKNMDSDYFQQY